MKKNLLTTFYILIPVLLSLLVSFASITNSSKSCSGLHVYIEEDASFIDSARVVEKIYERFDTLQGQKWENISLSALEELVDNIHFVEEGQVYRTVDNIIVVKINQRTPVARIINIYNESFYLDENGLLMNISQDYTARVPIVAGSVSAGYSPLVNLADTTATDRPDNYKVLEDLYQLISFIRKDSFLHAWVDQIYINHKGEFELVPKNGAHTIELGSIDKMETKFEKLKIFYAEGLTRTGWDNYKHLNLKFNNQIVCTK